VSSETRPLPLKRECSRGLKISFETYFLDKASNGRPTESPAAVPRVQPSRAWAREGGVAEVTEVVSGCMGQFWGWLGYWED
jgi:hypothetical protein